MPSPYTPLPLDDTHSVADQAGHIQHHDDLAHWLNSALLIGDVGSVRDGRLLGRTFDSRYASGNGTPTAGTVYLCRVAVPRNITITNIETSVGVAAVNGAASLANVFFGVYDPVTLARLAVSADASASMMSTGNKTIALTAPYAAVGVPGSSLLVAVLVGTQATTALQLVRASGSGNASSANFEYTAPNYVAATANTGASALPATASALTAGSNLWLMGLS